MNIICGDEMDNTIKGTITQSSMEEDSLVIEVRMKTGWFAQLRFNESNSYQILRMFGETDPVEKDPKNLINKEVILLEHPESLTFAPIAIRDVEKERWIYKKRGGSDT